jgi:hypothetical protein
MRSIVSFELDDACILPNIFDNRELFFPESNELTDIRITLYDFDHCISLLKQLGSKLYSFVVSILYVDGTRRSLIYKIPSVSNISLFQISLNFFLDFLSKVKTFHNDNLS